ncbi:MAG: hypothetical protein AAGF79_11120 [Pseudomonadota bacterium]
MRITRQIRTLPGIAGLALSLGLGALALPVAANVADTIKRTGLTQDDINVMSSTAAELYQTGTPQVGRTSAWSNPDTGARGEATLTGFASNCADIRHVVFTQRRPEAQQFVFRNCKTADGNWVLSP